jgi:sugar phosphate isomerase/epimerase
MRLVVSNIAWTNEEEIAVAEKLQNLGVKYIEIAPTKKWDNPTKASSQEIADYKAFWQSYGIEIVAFQSMLFSRPDLKIFESDENRQAALDYLKDFTRLARDFGAGVMVYGSPKNRQRGEVGTEAAEKIATSFFREIGDNAEKLGVAFCIEPNPTAYACDFVVNAAEGVELVNRVASPGFGLHLDIAGMTLAGDDIAASIRNAAPLLKHFHISSPYLEQVEDRDDVQHSLAAATLKEVGYNGFVSIEMRLGESGENVYRVERAVTFAESIYSS